MSTADVETFLARLYTDETLRDRFLRSPQEVLSSENFSAQQCAALVAIDPPELILASDSCRQKRTRHG